jgi:DNA transposition AAA+ family ATPase
MEKWKYDEELRSRVEHYIAARHLTQAEMALILKLSSPTRLSKYLGLIGGGEPEKDMPRVEARIRQWLRYEERTRTLASALFETSVTKSVADVLRQIRRAGDVGLIHGRAGLGKSCAAALYRREHDDVSMFTATYWRQGARDVETLLAETLDLDPAALASPWPGNVRRAVWMEGLFRGSERMIIIDNAHRLHLSGLKWIFDFHDSTGCAVALIGNPEVLDQLRGNDQLFSRVGLVREIKHGDDAEAIAEKMIAQYAPEAGAEILADAADVVTRAGHARTLRKQLVLTALIRKSGGSWSDAFAAAATQLLKPARKGAA